MPGRSTYKYKYAIVACARWEETDIVEWIEYHRILGFEHVFLYSNDDDPSVLRKTLAPYIYGNSPYITYFHWPHKGQQFQIYMNFLRLFQDFAEWICFLDIDEFITLKTAATIADFVKKFEDHYDCIYFNWLIFGNNDMVVRDSTLNILPYYTKRSSSVNLHTKNIVRSSCIKVADIRGAFDRGAMGFWHFWDLYPFKMRICDVLQREITRYAEQFPSVALAYVKEPGYSEKCLDVAYISHFQFKSEHDFVRRFERGGFANSRLWQKSFEDGSYKARLIECNAVVDYTLAEFWHKRMSISKDVLAPDQGELRTRSNFALFKPTEQSSVYKPSGSEPPLARVRNHGNDGCRTRTYGFHTSLENEPWWIIDLLQSITVSEIHVYNRVDNPECSERARGMLIQASLDRTTWRLIHVVGQSDQISGEKNMPLIMYTGNIAARYLKFSLPRLGILHLDEVEVYSDHIEAKAD